MKRCVLNACGIWVLAGGIAAMAMGRDMRASRAQEVRLEEALVLLEAAPTGERLLKKARILWQLGPQDSIRPFLTWGSASKTDAVLTRSFDPSTGVETRKREVRISLREDAGPSDLLLDLAHELVHATTPPEWDPYDPDLTPSKYVWNALEGPGGEVEAVYYECATAIELKSHHMREATGTWKRCLGYLEGDGEKGSSARAPASDELKNRILSDFYRVGSYRTQVIQQLAEFGQTLEALPLVSDASPRLYSSTGAAPYPLALLHEFGDLNRVACQNSHRRLATAQSHPEATTRKSRQRLALERFIKVRCSRAGLKAD